MGQTTILLVEDNPDDEALALRALQNSSVPNEVVVAHDGQEALDYIFGRGAFDGRDVSEQPRVVFLDIKLPKLNGLEVLRSIRSDRRTELLPVVCLTSSDEERDILEAYRSGANSYINKPVDFKTFVHQVRILGEYWLDINRPAISAH